MEHKISIKKIGIVAYDILSRADEKLTIHSIFANAVNIIYKEDYMITLLPPSYSCGVQSIIVSKQTFDIIKNSQLQVGDKFKINLKEGLRNVISTDLTIPIKLNYNHIDKIINNIIYCLSEMKNKSNQDGLSSYLFGISNMYTKMLDAKIGQIQLIIKKEDCDELSDKLCGILGLGPGLTPSGDDFIYGFMASLFYYYKFLDLDNVWVSKAISKVSFKAKALTTIISYNMLRSCTNGEFSEDVRNLLIGIFCSEDAHLLLQKVLQIGSSSGADIATGILYGMKILLMKEE